MKDIRPALRAILLADADIASLVGNMRIFATNLPQGQRSPSIVFHRITGSSDYHLQGDSGLHQAFMQIDAWAASPDLAVSLADETHDALSGFAGDVDYGSMSPQLSITIRGIFQINERDLFDNVTQLHRMSRDYNIFYAER
jgi:Protein of unknown function (DUF3168)